MSKIPLIKTILLGIALTLLAPIATKAATETWDPSAPIGQAWSLSNGNLTATSPDTGNSYNSGNPGINGQFGAQPIPLNAKTYFEVDIDAVTGSLCNTGWYYLLSAYGLGVGAHGLSYGVVDKHDEGDIINPSDYILYMYNRVIYNNGDVVSDPEDDYGGSFPPPSPVNAAPSFWRPHDVIGFAVDRPDRGQRHNLLL